MNFFSANNELTERLGILESDRTRLIEEVGTGSERRELLQVCAFFFFFFFFFLLFFLSYFVFPCEFMCHIFES